jgi:hypothetical protein
MTSEELARRVEELIRRTSSRVTGIGDEQYSHGDTQKFEMLNILELIDWTLEEVEDTVVYAAMQHIRLARLREAVETAIRNIGSTTYIENGRVQAAIHGIQPESSAQSAVGIKFPGQA